MSYHYFPRKKQPIIFRYSFNGTIIKRVNEVRDLGIFLETKLNFNSYIQNVISKSYKLLSFILSVSQHFRNALTFKTFYSSFVRSVLEFESVVWNPLYKEHIDALEKC